MRTTILVTLALLLVLAPSCSEEGDDDAGDDDSGAADDDSAADDDDSAGDDDDSAGDDDDSAGDDDDTVVCDARIPQDAATLQAAVDAAAFGDVLCAEAGAYPEHLDFGGKVVQLIGLDGSAATFINGSQTGPVVTFDSGESTSTVLQGFTLTGGFATTGGGVMIDGASPTLVDVVVTGCAAHNTGGGIHVTSGNPTLDHVAIRGNTADGEGGGLYVSGASVTLTNVVVSDNLVMSYGGGIAMQSSSAVLDHVLVAGNQAQRAGGGLFMNTSSADLTNVAFLDNTALAGDADGGGLYLLQASPVLTNVTVAGNLAGGRGGGLYLFQASPSLLDVLVAGNEAGEGGGICNDTGLPGFPSIAFCSVTGNAPDEYLGMTDPTGANGNVADAPEFLDLSATDPLQWDVHLGASSTLIDVGSPSLDDPDGTRADIGSWGGPGAGGWDLDLDGHPSWWQPGPYDPGTYPGQGWDCDDLDPAVGPGSGC